MDTAEEPKEWKTLRMEGLKEYAQSHENDSAGWLTKALVEVQKSRPGSAYEATSLCDLAQLYEERKQLDAAGPLYQKAVGIAEHVYKTSDVELRLILSDYCQYLQAAGRNDEASKLKAHLTQIESAPHSEGTIGAAEMKDDGTIALQLRAEGNGIHGISIIDYQPTMPGYDDILFHLGLLKPGQQKLVAPWK